MSPGVGPPRTRVSGVVSALPPMGPDPIFALPGSLTPNRRLPGSDDAPPPAPPDDLDCGRLVHDPRLPHHGAIRQLVTRGGSRFLGQYLGATGGALRRRHSGAKASLSGGPLPVRKAARGSGSEPPLGRRGEDSGHLP